MIVPVGENDKNRGMTLEEKENVVGDILALFLASFIQ